MVMLRLDKLAFAAPSAVRSLLISRTFVLSRPVRFCQTRQTITLPIRDFLTPLHRSVSSISLSFRRIRGIAMVHSVGSLCMADAL